MNVRILASSFILLVLPFAVCADEPKETRIKPIATFKGSHSQIRYETFNVIATEEGWQRLWKQHRGQESGPLFTESEQVVEIDFQTHYVVAVFVGTDWNWCEIVPRKRGDRVVVGFKCVGYGSEGRPAVSVPVALAVPECGEGRESDRETKEAALAPYAFVVLPKPVQTVIVEKDVRRQRDLPPEWKELFLFPASKNKK